MKCLTCGAENDPANRFCDQCGTKLEAAPAPTAAAPAAVAPAAAGVASPTTCPICGAAVLPGEAFCDECGAPLAAAPVVTSEAPAAAPAPAADDTPTLFAPPVASVAAEASVACPACGHQNLPGDRFCENCGASLEQPAAPAAAPAPAAEVAPAASAPVPAPLEPATPEPPAVPAPVEVAEVPVTQVPEPAPAAPAEDDLPAADQLFPAAEPAPAPAAPAEVPAPRADDAKRAELEAEIAKQDQIIAQFEQMQAMFGATTPPAVVQGLADARAARDAAQAGLDALAAPAPAAPAVDPAEVARLEGEIAQQSQIIAQFEQMQAMFGAATPPAVVQGLADARAALAKAQAELQALTGVVAPAPVAPAPVAPAPVAPAPVAPAAPVARLVVEASGVELPLVQDKAELIIGREDPISGIFPEVDLTGHGGETGGVSRQHAKLLHTGDQWEVVDLNSTNYTRVDSVRLEPNTPTPVRDGSRIQLGRVVLVFRA